ANPESPVVVLVHAEPTRLVDDRGAPTPVAQRAFRRLFDRLRLTRADAAEWAIVESPTRPDLARLNPQGKRPIVWLAFPSPSRAGLDPRNAPLLAERNDRIGRLAGAVRMLLDAGENVLVCVDPSDRPAIGEADPIVTSLAALGIKIDSGRPILRRESSPQGPLIHTLQVVRAEG